MGNIDLRDETRGGRGGGHMVTRMWSNTWVAEVTTTFVNEIHTIYVKGFLILYNTEYNILQCSSSFDVIEFWYIEEMPVPSIVPT